MKKLFAVPLLLLALSGCKSAAYVNHPGSLNTFDSQSYDSLLVTHSVIESTKADLAANKFPANIASGVKLAINGLITAYDSADTAYLIYHAAAAAGTATVTQQASVTSALVNVGQATSDLTQAKGGL